MPKPSDKKIKEVYDSIAEGFYNLRQQPITPELKILAEKWKPGKLLDIGCGIGNSTVPFAKKSFQCVGLDISEEMIKFAKKYSEKHRVAIDFKVGDILSLPLSERFYYVISIAVLHHLDSEEKRLKALEETRRVLKPGGKIFLTVWYKENIKKDAYISWTRKGTKYQRYYHFFSEQELKDLFKKSGFREVRVFLDSKAKNICISANK